MPATPAIRSARNSTATSQEKITAASAHLLFFALELNRIDDAVLEAGDGDPALGHYRPWLEDVRKEKPYQLEDRVEQLFHEKSVTGARRLEPALRRDDGGAPLHGRRRGAGDRADAQPPAGCRRGEAQGRGRGAGRDLQGRTSASSPTSPTRSPRTRRSPTAGAASRTSPAARHLSNRVEPEVVDALVAAVRAAYPRLSHRYYALKARWFGRDHLNHWDRNAPLPDVPTRTIPFGEARATVLGAYGLFAPEMADDRPALLRRALDRRAGPARQGAGRLRPSDGAERAPLRAPQLPGQGARRDDARPRARPRRPPGARRAAGRADGADAADAGRDGERLRRDADLPRAARRDDRPARAQGDARRQGRGHDQHGRPPDRLLQLRAEAAHRARARAN